MDPRAYYMDEGGHTRESHHGDSYPQNGFAGPHDIPMTDYDPNYEAHLRHEQSRDGQPRPRSNRPLSDGYYAAGPGPSHYQTDDSQQQAELLGNLPSRQLGAMMSKGTIRHRRHKSFHGTIRLPPGAELDEINQVLDADSEMEDRTGEEIEDMIRGMTTTLSRKKEIKRRISSRKKRKVGRWRQLKYSCGMGWQHFKYQVAEVMYSLELWRSHLKKIEGQFGTGVKSYFLFLKWLFLINIPIFLLTLGFVVTPQVLNRWYISPDDDSALIVRTRDQAYNNTSPSFTGKEFLTGEEWFTNTEMYYGFYTNETVELFRTVEYRMTYAYLFTCGGYYLLSLIILAQSILRSYRKYYVEGGSDLSFFLVNKVFCGWDYGITSNEAARLKHSSLYNELMEYMSVKKVKPAKTIGEKCQIIWTRIFTNLVVLGLLGGSGYLVYFISKENSITNTIPVLSKLALPLVITSINNILPLVFSLIEHFEKYEKPKNELYIHMLRTMTLRAANLGVLVFFWFDRTSRDTECWETHVGQEIYRLVIVDFIFILLYTFFFEFIRRIMSQYCFKRLDRAEFGIGRNTLDLIYSQALCWLGTFYSPLLSCVVILKLWVIFYVKRISVTQNCKPSMRPWRASRSHTIFLAFLFGFFLLTTVAVCCGIIFIKPSLDCGPYQGKDTTYQVVIDLIDSLKGHYTWLKDVIHFISSPGFIAGLVILLCMGVYYMRIAMIGHKEMVNLLRQQLSLEGKDKNFLLNLLQQVNKRSRHRGPDAGRQTRLMHDDKASGITSPGGRAFARQMMEASRM